MWLPPDFPADESPKIDVDRLSTFVVYSFGGMTIVCKDIFLEELSKCQNFSDTSNNIVDEKKKILAWLDVDTNLYWDAALIFQDPHGNYPLPVHETLNELSYAGFNDWRMPTTYELMTLLEKAKSEMGCYIKKPLRGRHAAASWACSYWNGVDSEYLDFLTGKTGRQKFKDNDGGWGSWHASFVASRSVRGEISISKIQWVNSLAKWAAKYNMSEFPTTEDGILNLKTFSLYHSNKVKIHEIPKEIGYLTGVTQVLARSAKIKLIPDEIYSLKDLRVLNLRDSGLEFVESAP